MEPARASLDGSGENVRLVLSGSWTMDNPRPLADEIQFDAASVRNISVDCSGVRDFDQSLAGFLYSVMLRLRAHGIKGDLERVPQGIRGLIAIALEKPPAESGSRASAGTIFERAGRFATRIGRACIENISFIGELAAAFLRLLTFRSRMRLSEFLITLEDCGPRALPIVTLISILVGLIISFIGAIQLQRFGAKVYVANLVSLSMFRELGGVMAAVIMAGRTGAAFAARLGTMQVNQEIDALKTMGISPMDFLVLPRVMALVLMMPLLCVYADLMGIVGGGIIGVSALNIPLLQFFEQSRNSVRLNDFFVGVSKSVVFGLIVAVCGCLYGMRCKRSAEAVGLATTAAVVTGIVWITVADGLFAVIFNILRF